MKCPKCSNAEIREEINLTGIIFNRVKKITYFCPLCPFMIVKNFRIKEEEYQAEMDKKRGII